MKPTTKSVENPKEMKPSGTDVYPNSPSGGKRVILYARVSTGDQEVENQLAQLRQYAASQQWRVVDEIVDTCSGSKGASEREGLNKVLGLAHQRRFDILLFWDLSRLSREGSRETIGHLTQLEGFGIAWHSYSEPYLSTLGMFSDAIVALLAALARQERLRISVRTKAGLQQARANGKTLGRPRRSQEKAQRAKELRASGLSFGKIGRELGISREWAYELANAR